MPGHEDTFVHAPLPLQGPNFKPFRLLTILPSANSQVYLECILSDANLLSKPPFKALSYVCGPPTPTVSILVNGKPYPITQNCHAALLRCRELDETPLWVDSICIHQSNNEEKGAQILLMKDIYPQASQVVVWLCHWDETDMFRLDEESEELAIDLVNELAEVNSHETFMKAAMRSSYELNSMVMASWSSLTVLLSHPWFERLWTFQEIALSTDALLVLNHNTMPYSVLRVAIGKTSVFVNGRRSVDVPFLAAEFMDIYAERSAFIGNRAVASWQRPSLIYQLRTTRDEQCFDARDRVFASLGLVDENVRGGIAVDYTKSLMQVYANASQVIVETSQDLEVVAMAGLYHSQSQGDDAWPSWVFDWRRAPLEQPQLLQYNLYNAAKSTIPILSFDNDLPSMTVRGVSVDRILGCHPEHQEDLTTMRNSLDYTWAAKGLALWQSHFSVYPTNEDPVSIWLSTITNDLSLSSASKAPERRSPAIIAAHKLFYSTRFASARDFDDQGFETVFSTRGHSRQSWQKEIQDAVYNFGQAVQYAVNKRRFFITEKGYMGFGPLELEQGDLVCVLEGCSVPVVMREMEAGGHLLVGSCFVSGLMDGEGLESDREEIQEVNFMIV